LVSGRMNTRNLKIYFAGPLFTQAERQWNAVLAETLRKNGYQVILPQETAQKMIDENRNFNPGLLFKHATQRLAECDVVLAIFDGPDADSGTAWECGYAFALGKKLVGIRTDLRRGGDDLTNVNLMLSNCVDSIIDASSFTDDVNKLARRVDEHLEPYRTL
jgi:nucleoside 2-deoxyribosyltransferase